MSVEVLGELVTERVAPSSIRLAQGIDQARLEQLRAGDQDPMEVAVRIAPGKGSHGTYTESALRKLVDVVQRDTLAGYRGHIRGDELPFRFDFPSTHWVGAEYRADGAYIRGVVDQREPDLKRLIRAGRITQPSILYTDARTERGADGEVRIVDLKPLSIDWAPLGRAGMSSAEVVGHEMQGGLNPDGGGQHVPTIRELLATLREQRATAQEVLGEMGFSAAEVLPHMNLALADVGPLLDRDAWAAIAADRTALGAIRDKLGVPADKPAGEVAATVVELQGELATLRGRDRTSNLDKAIERAQPAIPDFARPFVLDELTKACGEMRGALVEGEVDKALGKVLEQDRIKALVGVRAPAMSSGGGGGIHTQTSNRPTSGGQAQAPAGLRVVEREI
jgi:hypothetical protein